MSDSATSDMQQTTIKVQVYNARINRWSERAVVENDTKLIDFLERLEKESNVRVFCNGKLAFTMYRNVKFTGSVVSQYNSNENEDLS